MSHKHADVSSTLDGQAAKAALYQRDVQSEFARMAAAEGRSLYLEEDVPVVRDAFKHLSLLPWMQAVLNHFTAQKPVLGLTLPMPAAWSLYSAWDYETSVHPALEMGANEDVSTVSSYVTLTAKSGNTTVRLIVTQYVSLVHDADLNPALSFTYEFYLRARGDVDITAKACTPAYAKELAPLDQSSGSTFALGRVLEGAMTLLWLQECDAR